MYNFMPLDQTLRAIPETRSAIPPAGGWLRVTRQARGLTLQAVAKRLNISPQAVHQFEKSEAAGTISLRQLKNVAKAMGCRVEYAVVALNAVEGATPPPTAVDRDPASKPVNPAAESDRPELEHSLLMENQAAGRFD